MTCEELKATIKHNYVQSRLDAPIKRELVIEWSEFKGMDVFHVILFYISSSHISLLDHRDPYLFMKLVQAFGWHKWMAIKFSSNLKPYLDQVMSLFKENGFGENAELNFRLLNLWNEGLKLLSETIKICGFSNNLDICLFFSWIGDDWVKSLTEAIETVGLKEGVHIHLWDNKITDTWANYLLAAIQKQPLQPRVSFTLKGNKISEVMKRSLYEEADKQWFVDPTKVFIF